MRGGHTTGARRRVAVLLTLAGLALTASGCGGGSDDPDAPEGGGASGASTPAVTGPVPSEEPTPTPEAVAPATGPLLEAERVTVRAPQGWQRSRSGYLDQFPYLDGAQDGVRNTIVVSAPVAFSVPSLAEQAREVLRTEAYEQRPEVRAPVTVDGREWYHLAGQISAEQWLDRYGTVHNDALVSIEFRQGAELAEAERSEVVESVLATIAWPAAG